MQTHTNLGVTPLDNLHTLYLCHATWSASGTLRWLQSLDEQVDCSQHVCLLSIPNFLRKLAWKAPVTGKTTLWAQLRFENNICTGTGHQKHVELHPIALNHSLEVFRLCGSLSKRHVFFFPSGHVDQRHKSEEPAPWCRYQRKRSPEKPKWPLMVTIFWKKMI